MMISDKIYGILFGGYRHYLLHLRKIEKYIKKTQLKTRK